MTIENPYLKTIIRWAKPEGDKRLWITVALLALLSLIEVYSSTRSLTFRYNHGETTHYLFQHLKVMLAGFVFMIAIPKFHYRFMAPVSVLLTFLSILLLALTLISGVNINQAARWYNDPIFHRSFQPSEIAKFALILYIAKALASPRQRQQMNEKRWGFIQVTWPVFLACGLIVYANFSTGAILFVVVSTLLFVSGIKLKKLMGLAGIGLALFLLLLGFLMLKPDVNSRKGTWSKRIESFTSGDSEDNYQVEQSKIALVNGGIIGRLPGNSTQKNFLPHPYSDFIYAIIIEETGVLGGAIVVLLYLIIFYRCIRIALRNPGSFGSYATLGIGISIALQALVNMGVAVNLFPVTGQPLPMVSMGGTSLLFTSIGIGFIHSVAKHTNETETEEIPAHEEA